MESSEEFLAGFEVLHEATCKVDGRLGGTNRFLNEASIVDRTGQNIDIWTDQNCDKHPTCSLEQKSHVHGILDFCGQQDRAHVR